MKKDLHPKYQKCLVTCACGASFETRSTEDKLHVEICSQCHPFYTGKQKLVDTAGRVEQYIRKFEKSKKLQKATAQREEHQTTTPSGKAAAVETKAAAVETKVKAVETTAAVAGTKAKAGAGAGKAKGKTS